MTRRGYPMRQYVTQREPDQPSKCDELGVRTCCSVSFIYPEAMATERNPGDFPDDSDVFRRNAFLLIWKMMEMTREDTTKLVDEILHSIFFLGEINIPPFSPRELLGDDDDILDSFKEAYPEPFRHYSSQLPRRSPFSCLLDMVVYLEGQENEDEIRTRLQEITCELMTNASKKVLLSSTLCVSHANNTDSVRHYGVSATGPKFGKIMIAASCLSSYWDEYVADAVMTYYPENTKKDYFDGTIKVPEDVTCRAYSLLSGSEMEPCVACGNLFGLSPTCQREWSYGNCAEAESLSNLFKREIEVKEQSRPTSNTYTPENRERVKNDTEQELRNTLNTFNFGEWRSEFYKPSI